jgi:2-aminoadipate transaminase
VYFQEGRWRDYVQDLCAVYRQRRDAMLDALAEFFPREAEWTQPSGGLFIWATLPDFIDTGDLLAKALREERVAFVPGSAAYVDGRGGSSMRLNFSGADVDGIVEGVRRIGKVVDEQISLFSTFAGSSAASSRQEPDDPLTDRPPVDDVPLADVVELPRRGGERRAQGS